LSGGANDRLSGGANDRLSGGANDRLSGGANDRSIGESAGRGSVRRVDDRLGLAVDRVGLSGRTLVTYARDHVTVRTPSRPDFRDGNTIDLLAPPAPGELPGWIDRFGDTIGIMGARHVQLRWETPLTPDAPAAEPRPEPALAGALQDLGFELGSTTVLLLDGLTAPARTPAVELIPIEAPSAVPGGPVDRRWHAATVLYRYSKGETPDDWRDWDQEFTDWSVDVQRELATAERAQVWIAARHGGPVARLTVVHDRQGLASVQDVVVHPVHRRSGIASALTHRAIAHHLEVHPQSRVGIGADPGSAAELLYRTLGFRPHATVWTARRLPAA
jgi:GNAT superfamily N-acetyltransferase